MRTTLVTAANAQALRILCSQHVLDEVMEHRDVWSTKARAPVAEKVFIQRFQDEYLPLMRVVGDDDIPVAWLSPDEQQRLRKLAESDPDDIPSVKLALATRSLYLSKDKRALHAVYGSDSLLAKQAEWLDRLKAGSDAAELMRLLSGSSALGYAATAGLVQAGRRLYSAIGPASVILGAGAAYGAWEWIRHPSREQFRAGLGRFLTFLAEVAAVQRAADAHFDAALPAVPEWTELLRTNSVDAVVGRACISALVREGRGHQSAQELAAKIRWDVPCSDAKVRAVLRCTGCFVEIYRGRWQVGSVRQVSRLAVDLSDSSRRC